VKSRTIIGWREWVGLPDLGVPAIKAKVDTGARTSALHAYRLQPFRRDGALWVRFFVHPVQRRRLPEVACEAPSIGQRAITSSNGSVEHRYVIRTRLAMNRRRFPIELSLTDRDQLGFRMLIGRQAMRERFLVDPDTAFGLGEHDYSEFYPEVSSGRRRKDPR
jgi:hypothetical protein